MSENKTDDYIRCDMPNKTFQFLSDAEIKAIKAEAFAAGQKAERERCRRIALGAFLIIAPESLSQRAGADSVREQIAAAIMEDKNR